MLLYSDDSALERVAEGKQQLVAHVLHLDHVGQDVVVRLVIVNVVHEGRKLTTG